MVDDDNSAQNYEHLGNTIMPGSFRELFNMNSIRISWFIGWRYFVASFIITILLLGTGKYLFKDTAIYIFLYIFFGQAGISIFVFEHIAKMLSRKLFGYRIDKFIGWSITWRFLLILLGIIFFVYLSSAIAGFIVFPILTKLGHTELYLQFSYVVLIAMLSIITIFFMLGRVFYFLTVKNTGEIIERLDDNPAEQ
jgi:hypothetical protein